MIFLNEVLAVEIVKFLEYVARGLCVEAILYIECNMLVWGGGSFNEEGPMRLFRKIAEKVILSGFKFTVTTLDPVNRPMPSIN